MYENLHFTSILNKIGCPPAKQSAFDSLYGHLQKDSVDVK